MTRLNIIMDANVRGKGTPTTVVTSKSRVTKVTNLCRGLIHCIFTSQKYIETSSNRLGGIRSGVRGGIRSGVLDTGYEVVFDPGYEVVLDPGYEVVLDPGYEVVLDLGY